MKLTARKPIKDEPEPFLPELRRYKYYPIDNEEEDAIKQAENCLDALSEKMTELGDKDKAAILGHSFDVIRRMRLELSSMGATRTTMGYN